MSETNCSGADLEKLKLEVMSEAKRRYQEVLALREEIMTAFIAKFQCEPDEMVQVQWQKSASEMLWFLVRKSDCIYCEKCKELISKGEIVDERG
jgi:DNA-directed RNA polymerase alpha subunit